MTHRVTLRKSDNRILESQSGAGDLDVLRNNAISMGLDPDDLDFVEMEDAEFLPRKAAQLKADHDALPRLVPKSLIIKRLHEAGKLAAASAALNANLYLRERWYAPDRPAVYADDPEALALLAAIGADPAVILAPE